MTGHETSDARLLRRVGRHLGIWSGGLVLAVLVAVGLLLYASVERTLEMDGVGQLQERARNLERFLSNEPGQPGPIGLTFGGPGSGTITLLVAPDGSLIGPPGLQVPAGLPDQAGAVAARSGAGSDIRTSVVAGVPIRILSEPINRGGRTYVLQLIQDITAEQRTLRALVAVLAVGGLAAVLVAIAAGSIVARRALVPIRDALRRQRAFAADASHELRTPLAVVRASVDHLRRNPDRPVSEVGDALNDITAEVDHLTAMVDDLLLLARSDSGAVELTRERVDLGEAATEATGGLATLAATSGVRLELDPKPVEIVGDPLRIRQLVGILVDNAIRHGPAGGTVSVAVARDERGATLTVDDDGPGIAPDDRAHVFDRFWRAPGVVASGTGLGLAIAAWVVDQHGGTIAPIERPGGGSRFVVTLPLA